MTAVHAAHDGGQHRVDEGIGKGVRVRVCVCERVRKGFCGPRKECVFGKGTCSLSDTEGKAKVFAFVSMGADTKFGGWFELQAAYLSDCSVVLPLRPSARAAPPLGPRLFNERLRAWERVRVLRVSMGIDRKANRLGPRRTSARSRSCP